MIKLMSLQELKLSFKFKINIASQAIKIVYILTSTVKSFDWLFWYYVTFDHCKILVSKKNS